MDQSIQESLLVALVLTPAAGALAAGLCPNRRVHWIPAIGWTFSIVTLVIWVVLQAALPAGNGILVAIHLPWVPDLGIGLHIGLDRTGLIMAGMVSFLAMAAVVGTLPPVPELSRRHIVCLLLAEMGMLGVVSSWDLLLFILCWEVTLVPFFFLMGQGPTRGGVTAATRFFVTSVASSVLMWVGVLLVVKAAGMPRTFDLEEIVFRLDHQSIRSIPSVWLFAPAFLVRMAAVPLHTWFPAAAAEIPSAAGILLAGGVLPLGGYGLSHVLFRLLGSDLGGMRSWFMVIGLVTAVGAGLASVVQRDLKRLMAHICMSQMGLALVGITFLGDTEREAGLLMLVASGIGGASLFLFAGVICKSRGTQRIVEIEGLWRSYPVFAGFAFAGIASAAAIPGTGGFVGIFHLLKNLSSLPWFLVLAALAVCITGISILWTYRRVSGGTFQEDIWAGAERPRKRQLSVLILMAVVIVLLGIMPGLITGGKLAL